MSAGIDQKKFPAVDVLRAFAVLSVLAFHCQEGIPDAPAWLRTTLSTGWNGVYLFFVISGFLVGRLAIREIEETGTLSLTRFWIKRFFRTWPLYFFLLLLEFSLGRKPSEPGLISYLTFTQNFYPLHFLTPTWSLAVEEQFYALLPLGLLLLVQSGKINSLGYICGFGVAGAVLSRILGMTGTNTLAVMDSLFLGLLLAYFHERKTPALDFIRRHSAEFTLLGLSLSFAAALAPSYRVWMHFYQTLLGLAYAITVAANTGPRAFLASLNLPALGLVATTSYSIYLTQDRPLYRVRALADHWLLTGSPRVGFVLGGSFLAALAWGWIFFFLVERPGMQLRQTLLRRLR